MQDDAYLKCIDPQCGLEYPIKSTNVQCEKGHMLDVKYKNKPSDSLNGIVFCPSILNGLIEFTVYQSI